MFRRLTRGFGAGANKGLCIVAVILLALLGNALGVALAADMLSAESQTQQAITMVAEVAITQKLADDVSQISLAILSDPQAPETNLLTLGLVKELSPFGFDSWLLTLSGDLLPETAQKPGATRLLHRFIPQYDHTYRAHLSYDAETGMLSVLVVNLTNQSVVYSAHSQVSSYASELIGRKSEYVLQVEPVFTPVGTAWYFLAGLGDALTPTVLLSHYETAILELTLASPRSTESLNLVAERDDERIELVHTSLSTGKYNIPVDIEKLTPGWWQIRLELTSEGQVWSSGLTHKLQVITGRVSARVTELQRRHGEVDGVIYLESDGPVSDVHLQLHADIYRMTDGEWQLNEERVLLYETKVDVSGAPMEIPFDLGDRLDKDATHKLHLTFTLVNDQDIALSALKTELQLPAGDSGFMGGIPQIDVSAETWRQTVVDRIPGEYLGHPDSVLLADDQTILIVYPLGHGGATVLRRSSDGGKTWSERLPVPENWSRTANVPTIFRLTDPEGVERLVAFQNLTLPGAEVHRDNAEEYLSISISEDNGNTWTPFQQTGLRGPVAPNTVIPISGGRYLTVFQLNSRIQMAISSDGGRTWSNQRSIASYPNAALVEPAAIKSPDGTEIAVLIRENSRRLNSMLIVSKDEGLTWTTPVELPDTLVGDRHKPHYAPDGRLVITFRDVFEESPSYSDFVAWVGTYDDLVNLRPGQYRVKLLENRRLFHDTGYAGLELLPDGTFVSTTYVPLYTGERPSVVSIRFTLDELDTLLTEQY
jgi:hypothetical protein